MTPSAALHWLCFLRETIANAQETDCRRRRWAELLLGEDAADAAVLALDAAILELTVQTQRLPEGAEERESFRFPRAGQVPVRGRNGR